MALFDFLKRRELEEIANLKTSINMQKEEINKLQSECELLKPYSVIMDIENERQKLKEECNRIQLETDEKINQKQNILEQCNKDIDEKKKEIDILNDEILLQTYGIYTPLYDFQKLEDYKERLAEIRDQEKQMVRDKEAGVSSINWLVDGSSSKGRALTNQQIKQMIRNFNVECDLLIDKVKFNNIEAFIQKIRHTAEIINKLNNKSGISISDKYVDLKIEELRIAYEYAKKKQEEKDRIAEIRRIQKEEERVQKELEEARKDIVKEQAHYNNALQDIIDKIISVH